MSSGRGPEVGRGSSCGPQTAWPQLNSPGRARGYATRAQPCVGPAIGGQAFRRRTAGAHSTALRGRQARARSCLRLLVAQGPSWPITSVLLCALHWAGVCKAPRTGVLSRLLPADRAAAHKAGQLAAEPSPRASVRVLPASLFASDDFCGSRSRPFSLKHSLPC